MKLSYPVSDGPGQWNRGWIPGVHRGVDYGWFNADPANSQRTYAAAPGRVVKVDNRAGFNLGWGNRIWIEHAPGIIPAYNHYNDDAIQVTVGQQVSTGTYLGQMGNTGDSEGTHLHFELWITGERVDPQPYFTQDLPGTTTPAGDTTTPLLTTDERENDMTIRYLHRTEGNQEFMIVGAELGLSISDPKQDGYRVTTDVLTAEGWGAVYGTSGGDSWKGLTRVQYIRVQEQARLIAADYRRLTK